LIFIFFNSGGALPRGGVAPMDVLSDTLINVAEAQPKTVRQGRKKARSSEPVGRAIPLKGERSVRRRLLPG
jgi:hypothetical protein